MRLRVRVGVGGSGNWEGLDKVGHDPMGSGMVRRGPFVHGRLAVSSPKPISIRANCFPWAHSFPPKNCMLSL